MQYRGIPLALLILSPDTRIVPPNSFQSGTLRLPGSPVRVELDSVTLTVRFKGLVPGVEEAWDYIRTNFPSKTHEAAAPPAMSAPSRLRGSRRRSGWPRKPE